MRVEGSGEKVSSSRGAGLQPRVFLIGVVVVYCVCCFQLQFLLRQFFLTSSNVSGLGESTQSKACVPLHRHSLQEEEKEEAGERMKRQTF